MPPTDALPRKLGDLGPPDRGPLVVLTAGLHGNEPAGVFAIGRVLQQLSALEGRLAGRVVGLTGNRGALRLGQRFVRRDLNRRWYANELERLRRAPLESLDAEDREQRELFDALSELERHGPMHVLDLHTTSGPSEPFACFGDTLRNRHLALTLPIPSILGLEEIIDGAMLGYLTERGHAAISVEAGEHDEPETVARHEAAIWLFLVAAGALSASDVPSLAAHRSRLEQAATRGHRVVEVRHRHVVLPDDEFVMKPGYSSFDAVDEGDVVASDRHGPVRAPMAGLMLMPRYQGQGEDGFFLVRPIAPFWLRASSVLRALRASNLVSRLPGVTREGDHRVIVDPTIARSFAVELMHLCGFRRTHDRDGKWTFARREQD